MANIEGLFEGWLATAQVLSSKDTADPPCHFQALPEDYGPLSELRSWKSYETDCERISRDGR